MATTTRDFNARAVGVPWVREEDYPAFLAICEDADRLPPTWQRFAQFSEQAEQRYRANGYLVVRAYIDPETFPDWCAQRDTGINSQARMRFAASIADEQSRNRS
jgi:hypothetical protein